MKIANFIYQIERSIVFLVMSAIVVIGFIQVVLRYVFATGIPWATEFILLGFITGTLAAASTGFRSKVHVSVRVLVIKFPYKVQKALVINAAVLAVLIFGFLCYQSIEYVLMVKESGTKAVMLGYPLWMCIVYIPVSFALMAMHNIELLWEVVRLPAGEIDQSIGII